jgi:hypothetical protein
MFIATPSVALARRSHDGVAGEYDSSHAGLEIYKDEVKNVRVDLAEASGMIAVDNFTIKVAIHSSEDRRIGYPTIWDRKHLRRGIRKA